MTIYRRTFFDSGSTQEVAEGDWLDRAREYTFDVDLARREGFRTAGARYWVADDDHCGVCGDRLPASGWAREGGVLHCPTCWDVMKRASK